MDEFIVTPDTKQTWKHSNEQIGHGNESDTVDGRNPAPPEMYKTL